MYKIDYVQVIDIVKAARPFFTDYEAASHIHIKGLSDYVTDVDFQVQSYFQQKLVELYPEIQFMGEEADNSKIDMNGPVWVLDPVDGTTNLIHDYPNSAISLAFMNRKEILAGIVYNPFSDEMFYAEKGKGSFLNGKKIHVSNARTMQESLIAVGTSSYYKEEAEENFRIFTRIFKDCQDIRRCGCASLELAYVACGRIDGFIENHLKLWDYAAGALIVREAGGKVFNYTGEELPMELDGNVAAGNPWISKVLTESYL